MGENFLFDILGIIVGFASIMLLLSLLVTTLTQIIVQTFSIREKNLFRGMSDLFGAIQEKDGSEIATSILSEQTCGKRTGRLKTSWLKKEEMISALDANDLNKKQIDRAIEWYPRMERQTAQRFKKSTQFISLGCSFIIAIVFQVSAPHLLQRLSVDPEFRAEAQSLTNSEEPLDITGFSVVTYEEVSEEALVAAAKAYPNLNLALEEASGQGASIHDLLAEVSLVLEDYPERDAFKTEYHEKLNKLRQEKIEDAISSASQVMNSLSLINITPFSQGFRFYINASNLVGMLVTILLISLGAPFWYNVLQRTASLRDAMKPSKDDTNDKKKDKKKEDV